MALVYDASSSDIVVVTDASSIQSMESGTAAMWVKPTSYSTFGYYWCKDNALIGMHVRAAAPAGESFRFFVAKTSTGSMYSNNVITSNGTWYFIACTWNCNGTGSFTGKCWWGTETALVSDVTNTVDAGSGAYGGDSGKDLHIGAGALATDNQSYPGAFGLFALWKNRELTQNELAQVQFYGASGMGAQLYYEMGMDGTTSLPDYSGNGNTAASVTGLALSNHHATLAPFTRYREDDMYVVAAAASTLRGLTLLGAGV